MVEETPYSLCRHCTPSCSATVGDRLSLNYCRARPLTANCRLHTLLLAPVAPPSFSRALCCLADSPDARQWQPQNPIYAPRG